MLKVLHEVIIGRPPWYLVTRKNNHMINGRHFEFAQIPETARWLEIQFQYMASDLISYASLKTSQYSVYLSLVDLPGWWTHWCSRKWHTMRRGHKGSVFPPRVHYVYLVSDICSYNTFLCSSNHSNKLSNLRGLIDHENSQMCGQLVRSRKILRHALPCPQGL